MTNIDRLTEAVEELLGRAEVAVADIHADEVFSECLLCKDVDGHTEECPVPFLKKWLKDA